MPLYHKQDVNESSKSGIDTASKCILSA